MTGVWPSAAPTVLSPTHLSHDSRQERADDEPMASETRPESGGPGARTELATSPSCPCEEYVKVREGCAWQSTQHVRGRGRAGDGLSQPNGSTTDVDAGGPSNTGLTVRCTPSRTLIPSPLTHHPSPSTLHPQPLISATAASSRLAELPPLTARTVALASGRLRSVLPSAGVAGLE